MRRLIPVLALAALALALLVGPATVASAGGGAHCTPDFTDAESDVVRLSENCFVPTIARVEKGAEVRFVNEDHAPHTVTGAVYIFGDLDEFTTGERSFSFREEGIYPYVCVLHPGMAGAIVVGDGEGKVSTTSVTGGSFADASDDTSSNGDSSADAVAQEPDTQPASSNNQNTLGLLATLIVAMGAAFWWVRKRPQAEV